MAARAYWKGYLRLSLVTCPVELFPASSLVEQTHFHIINKKTGNRVREQMVDEETGKIARGNIASLSAPFEPMVKDIVFIRLPARD